MKVDDPKSPLTAMFEGKGFEFSDEIYTFKDPYSREKLHILLSVDWENASLPKGNRDDNDYALAWIHDFGKGHVFYCAFGHQHEVFWNPTILKFYLADTGFRPEAVLGMLEGRYPGRCHAHREAEDRSGPRPEAGASA